MLSIQRNLPAGLSRSFSQVGICIDLEHMWSTGSHVGFCLGHKIPIQHLTKPGLQADMEDPKPVSDYIPTENGGYQLYKAAGKLEGKKAIITGGDSGIGRATAILFGMEGASSLIIYLPEEEKDAQATKKRVEETGQQCHCLAIDIRTKENCRKVIATAIQTMGAVDILVNNAAFQNMLSDISELDELVEGFESYRIGNLLTVATGSSGSGPSTPTFTRSSTFPSMFSPT